MKYSLRQRTQLSLSVLVAAFAGIAAPAWSATLSVSVLTADGKPMSGAVVTVHSFDPKTPSAAPVHAAITQVNLAFVPDLLIVPVGSKIDFPNDDSVNHQIYSFSPAKRFQLPLYRGKPYPPVPFEQPGLVTLGCNIHDAMLAYIVVTDAHLFGRTDSAGGWTAIKIPGGKYRITVWHPRLRDDPKTLERAMNISDSEVSEIKLRFAKPLKPAPLDSRPHSWDTY